MPLAISLTKILPFIDGGKKKLGQGYIQNPAFKQIALAVVNNSLLKKQLNTNSTKVLDIQLIAINVFYMCVHVEH